MEYKMLIYDAYNRAILKQNKVVTTLRTNYSNGNSQIILVSQKSTNTQSKYMKNNLEEQMRVQAIKLGENNPERNGNTSDQMFTLKASGRRHIVMDNHQEITETSQKSTQKNYQTSTASLADFLARHFLLQVSEKDLKTQEGHSSLTLREYCEQNDLDYSSLKTLKDFSVTTVDELSKPSSKRLMNWGTTANGKLLTARITESHKTGKGSTLSDTGAVLDDLMFFR